MDKDFYICQCPYCGHKMGIEATKDTVVAWTQNEIKIQCFHCQNYYPMFFPYLYKGSESEVLNQCST